MSASNADTVAIYRASIVGAVKRSSVLMADLVRQVRSGWPLQETHAGGQEALALQQLAKNESRLVVQYPLAMLELFAQGGPALSGAASVTGKLVEIDKDDVRLRVEMVRARQRIAHEAAPALSELDTLIGAAQGFDRVQPERNPLRPGNYVRALFGVVYGVGVPRELARLWIVPMQEALGGLLAREYRRVSEELRARGVQPLHYVSAGRSRFAGLTADDAPRPDAAESFLSPLGNESLPSLDSSMWDSLRSAATLGSSAVADDFAPTTPGPVRGSPATTRQPLAARAAPVVARHDPVPPPNDLRVPSAHAPLDVSAPPDSQGPGAADAQVPPVAAASAAEPHSSLEDHTADASLNVGDWVNIEGAHGVVRTQLTWLSPRRTLFLFTQADGSTQSMTSRMVAKLLQSGAIKPASA